MPCLSLFKAMCRYQTINLQLDQPYGKMSFRNRCIIADSQGMQTLSIPIRGGRGFRGPYNSVVIDDRQPWNLHHWRAVYSAYGRSPWFEFYANDLKELYFFPPKGLADWNILCLQWLFNILNIPYPRLDGLEQSDEHDVKHHGYSAYEDPNPRDFQSGHSGDYLPKYIQVFQEKNGFIPNLSMLDFVFCAGPSSVREWLYRENEHIDEKP